MTGPQNNHGGPRPGSGRPRFGKGLIRPVSLGLPADLLTTVDKQAKRWECSRSAAVVRMLTEWLRT